MEVYTLKGIKIVMEPIRLGYACINTCLTPEYGVNSGCIAKTFRDKGSSYAIKLAKNNLQSVLKILEWNEDHGIKVYRMSSDMFPHMTNEEFIQPGDNFAYDLNHFSEYFDRIGEFATKYNHRLTFHPGQYNQIGTLKEQVFENTKRDLLMHAQVLNKCKLDLNSVMVVHGGGSYGDKPKTLQRWVKNFQSMNDEIKERVVIENCERQYNYKDMLWLSKKICRPVVFDTHHHSCYYSDTPTPNPETFMPDIIKTWKTLNLRPKFHISEQAPDKKLGAHSDYVEIIPDYLLGLNDIDIMIEAKKKEQATLRLYDKYFKFNEKEWVR